jgi:hypothetical protein
MVRGAKPALALVAVKYMRISSQWKKLGAGFSKQRVECLSQKPRS